MGAAQSNASRQCQAENNAPDLTSPDEFSNLAERHERIRSLFRAVAQELETTERGGRDHPLYKEWSILQRRHDQIFHDSVQNAVSSAECLKAFKNNIVTWQCSSTPEINKKGMVGFKQALERHRLEAHDISVSFEKLGEAIKRFKSHIPGFWTRLARSAIDALDRLLDNLLGVVEWVTSHVFEMHETGCYSSSGYVHISTHPNDTRRAIVTNREKLGNLLSKTVKTWKALDVTYAHLLGSLAAACSVVNDPEVFDVYLKDAGSSCTVLYECMSTYSTE